MKEVQSSIAAILGKKGAKKAVDHANRKTSNWSKQAIECVRVLALGNAEMTSETARDFAERQMKLPLPPDERAWGGILPAAARAGHIKKKKTPEGHDVFVTGKNLQSHGRPVRVWVSRLYRTRESL